MVLWPFEVHRGLVVVEGIEHRRERLAPTEHLRRLRALAVHVDDEVRIFGEERLLALGVSAVGTVRVRVDELADRQAVRELVLGDLGVDHRAPRSRPTVTLQ